MGAPLGPGWAKQAAFLGQTWLHHYWVGETTRHGQHYFLQEQSFSDVGLTVLFKNQQDTRKTLKLRVFPRKLVKIKS